MTARPSARGSARRRSARTTPGRPAVLHGAPVHRATPRRGEPRRVPQPPPRSSGLPVSLVQADEPHDHAVAFLVAHESDPDRVPRVAAGSLPDVGAQIPGLPVGQRLVPLAGTSRSFPPAGSSCTSTRSKLRLCDSRFRRSARWRARPARSYTSAGCANGVFSFEREFELDQQPVAEGLARQRHGLADAVDADRRVVGPAALPALDIGLPPLLFGPAAAGDQLRSASGSLRPAARSRRAAPRCCRGAGRSPRAACTVRPASDRVRPSAPRPPQGLRRPASPSAVLPRRQRARLFPAAVAASCACLARAMRSRHSAVSFRTPSSAARRASDRSSSSWREAACGRNGR